MDVLLEKGFEMFKIPFNGKEEGIAVVDYNSHQKGFETFQKVGA